MSKQNQSPVRIKDIALKAGVSTGTVDRVLHGRGKVSQAKEEKVIAAIKALKYEPNIMARSLAMNASFTLAIMLPNFSRDSFWQAQLNGIKKGLKDIKDFGFSIQIFEFDDEIKGSLKGLRAKIIEADFNAVLIAPTITNEAHDFLDFCSEKNLPYVLVNTSIARDDALFIGYVGQNSFQSGRLAAQLLSMVCPNNGCLSILHMEKEVDNSEHMVQKENGFLSYFENHNNVNYQCVVKNIPTFQKRSQLKEAIQEHLEKFVDIKGLFVTTSRIHYLTSVLQEINRQDIFVVGYDLIEENRKALQNYERMFLINQNPEKQGYSGLLTLFNFLLKKGEIKRKHFLPLDVITKENISTYIDA